MMAESSAKRMNVFERYLTLWVALCIAAGTFIGSRWPGLAGWFDRFTVAQISIPVAVLIWLMIYPMMLKVDFASIKRVGERKQGLVVTTSPCFFSPTRLSEAKSICSIIG